MIRGNLLSPYRETVLANGLRVITIPMRSRSTVAVAIWLRTGSRFEPLKVSGASHFLEHMLFKGTKKRTTRQIKEEIEGVGGVLNAFTGEESTCYYAKLLAPYLGKALDVLSDMVNHAVLEPSEFNKERTVILEEIKMYKDQPSQYVHELIGELLWENQPLGRPIAGSLNSVTRVTRTEIFDYKRRYYHPRNILVSVAGPVSPEEVFELVRMQFKAKSRLGLSRFSPARSLKAKQKTLFIEKDAEQVNFVIGMHGLSRYHAHRYKLSILNIILGSNMSSRLFEEVREQRGLAYDIRSGLSFFEDAGALTISAGVQPDKTVKALGVIMKVLGRLKRHGVKDSELNRAKEYFLSQLEMGLEDTMDHALWAGERMLYSNEMPDLEGMKACVARVRASDVKEVARKIFKGGNLNLSLIGPLSGKVQNAVRRQLQTKSV